MKKAEENIKKFVVRALEQTHQKAQSGGRMSHFNQGNVWGTVIKTKEGKTKEKKTPFLDLEIDCGNPEYGKVKAYGRLWGKEKIASFLEAYKGHEKDIFRFKGFYGTIRGARAYL